jgi:Poly(ADP-ribose) polymerase catalytic domain
MVAADAEQLIFAPIPYAALKQRREGVIDYFLGQCDTLIESFHYFHQKYPGSGFQANRHLSSPNSKCMRQRFESALVLLSDNDFLQVAFHGTRAFNVTSILQKGLDPMLRDGQSFGAGEYFTVDPLIAETYCRCNDGETLQIVVCVVILPKWPATVHIVINNPNHHIPIGVMQGVKIPGCFRMLSENQKQMLARRSINFQKRLQHCELAEQIDRIKRQIVLDLKKEPSMASNLYRQFSALLRGTPENKEILRKVLARHFGDAVIRVQFPGLLESCTMNDTTSTGEAAISQNRIP